MKCLSVVVYIYTTCPVFYCHVDIHVDVDNLQCRELTNVYGDYIRLHTLY